MIATDRLRRWPGIGLAADLGTGALARSGAAVIALVAVAFILGHYYDRFWYPPDEGSYAYIARQILRGGVLNRDIQDIHAGYVNFANAAAFYLFGEDLLSLRYPLVVMGLVQAALAFAMFRRRGPWIAALAAVALTALSTVQFLNPSANWYALFLAVVTTAVLSAMPRDARGRAELVGFLIVAAFLFRQLTGIFIAMGAVSYLLCEPGTQARGGKALARSVAAVTLAGLAGYMAWTTQLTGWVLFGLGPVLVLAAVLRRTALSNRETADLVLRLALGGAAAALPLLAYHLAHGSLRGWFDDTVLAALALPDIAFMKSPIHLYMLLNAATVLARGEGPAAILNGFFWAALLLVPLANGAMLAHRLWRSPPATGQMHPLPFIAIFHALVSVHLQIPVYLWFSTGLSVMAFLWLAGADAAPRPLISSRWASAAFVIVLSAVALHYQAAQPATRGLFGILKGERAEGDLQRGPTGASLRLQAEDARRYAELVRLIEREVAPGQPILALPNNPELYFLADRPAAVRFFNAALGVRSEADAAALVQALGDRPPKLVFFAPRDKYTTAPVERVMLFVRQHYEAIGHSGEIDIYRWPQP